MIEAKIVCDSVAPSGVRLTTFVLTYPRMIHSEFMTHRMLSRNASSSRAIPVNKQIQMVMDNPAIPLAFRKNQKGMQAGDLLDNQDAAVAVWLQARDFAVGQAKAMVAMDIHKQYANRILEPFAHITVVATATDWNNFFALRCHEMAQPEIHALADQMYALYKFHEPDELEIGEWHLPFVTEEDKNKLYNEAIFYESTELYDQAFIKMSVARCARVSYLNHEGKSPTLEEDEKLYERLIGNAPIHASPAEHQAMAMDTPDEYYGNFRSWLQYRKTLPNENVDKFDGPAG